MIVTEEMLISARTGKGGYSRKQIELAKEIVGQSKWKKKLRGMNIEESKWEEFCLLSSKNSRARKKAIINKMATKKDDFWKPERKDIPDIKKKGKNSKNNGKRKARRKKLQVSSYKTFYESREWRELRVKVLEKYECKCMMCGRSPKDHGIVIHVDHIKPRSKYPELELDFNNLQILCEDCYLGKLNKYETDWRPLSNNDLQELDIAYAASERI